MRSFVGQQLGRYEVLEEIGSGGMGVVCRAHDSHLCREVALKFLPLGAVADEADRKRFRVEALALAKLNHPNIATLYDFEAQAGIDFLVIEYIEGETLDATLAHRRLEEAEVIRLGEQLVSGLATAHERGVLHRDLKPGNLRVTPDGLLKILDFGIAKLLYDPSSAGSSPTLTAIGKSSPVGTPAYMAPEQLRNAALDVRTDIYGAGAVLYEMACGLRPFPQGAPADLVQAVLHSPPPAPRTMVRISARLEAVILKALAKSPNQRHQTARELLEDLRNLASASVAPRRRLSRAIDSIAVLPFENETGESETDYICEGLTEAIINVLSTLPEFKKVIARSSVYRYGGKNVSPEQAGRDLDVRSVLVGRLGHRANNIRVSVELIDVANSRHLWGSQYATSLAEISGIEQSVAGDVAKQLGIKLRPRKKSTLGSSRSKAYDHYLKGRYYWNKRPGSGMLQKATEFFQQAIEADPKFALAHAGLADAYNTQGAWESGVLAPQIAFPKASMAVEEALRLDPQLAEAHAASAYTALHFEWNLEVARQRFQTSLELNPGYVHCRHWYAHMLIAAGRFQEALAESLHIIQLDPLDPVINTHLPWHYWMVHDFPRSVEAAEKSLDLEPNLHWGHFFAGLAYEQLHEFGRALDSLNRSVELSGGSTVMRTAQAHALAKAGDHAASRRALNDLKAVARTRYVSSFELGLIHLTLNDADEGWGYLDRAVEERSAWIPYIKVEPRLAEFRNDTRFQTLLTRIGVPSMPTPGSPA